MHVNVDMPSETLIGIVGAYGIKDYNGVKQKTILIKNIKKFGEHDVLSENHWFLVNKQFRDLGELPKGEVVIFDAQLHRNSSNSKYSKASVYHVMRPTNVRVG